MTTPEIVKNYSSDLHDQNWSDGLQVPAPTHGRIMDIFKFYIQGTYDGRQWLQSSCLEEADEAVVWPTLNELLLEYPDSAPLFYASYYPGLNPAIDTYFENLLRKYGAFGMLEVGEDRTPLMNAAFRAYHDGWVSSVRQYRNMVFIETFANTPEDWAKGELKRPCTSLRESLQEV